MYICWRECGEIVHFLGVVESFFFFDFFNVGECRRFFKNWRGCRDTVRVE